MLSWSRRSCIQTGTSKKLTSWHSLSYWTFRLAWFMDYKFYKPCMMGLRLWILLLLVISDDLSPLPTDRFGYFFYYDFIWIVFFFMPSPGFVVSLWSSKFLLFRWIFHTFFFFFSYKLCPNNYEHIQQPRPNQPNLFSSDDFSYTRWSIFGIRTSFVEGDMKKIFFTCICRHRFLFCSNGETINNI